MCNEDLASCLEDIAEIVTSWEESVIAGSFTDLT